MLRLHRLTPLVAQVFQRQAGLTLERALDPDVRCRVEHLAYDLVAPSIPDILPERLAVAVREVLVGTHGHLLDRRKVAVDRRIAYPRLRQNMVRAAGEIFGHAFHE